MSKHQRVGFIRLPIPVINWGVDIVGSIRNREGEGCYLSLFLLYYIIYMRGLLS